MSPVTAVDDLDALVTVAAHNLLGTMGAVSGLAQLLHDDWEQLAPRDRGRMLDPISAAADAASVVLVDLVRMLPPDLLAFRSSTGLRGSGG